MLSVPNLPEKRISLAAVGNYPGIISALHTLGIDTLSFKSDILPSETARHQDMLLCHTGENRIFLAPDLSPDTLIKKGFSVKTGEEMGSTYPSDVKLNVAVSRDFFIYNPKTASDLLVAELIKLGKRGIAVKQGYTKCSVCFVTENALITDDESVYEAVKSADISTLLISKGDIYLSDTHYGFIGGATGKIDKTTLAVTGSLQYHSDGNKIKEFCKSHGVSVFELTDGRIIDVGGILPLKQRSLSEDTKINHLSVGDDDSASRLR